MAEGQGRQHHRRQDLAPVLQRVSQAALTTRRRRHASGFNPGHETRAWIARERSAVTLMAQTGARDCLECARAAISGKAQQ
ncbi:hypothetical protein CHELA17_60629 [Chelatococcus asaccharovorans]|nr:hypothetical protein CHELA17_60629 [Chelatococcus asaccharovorans]